MRLLAAQVLAVLLVGCGSDTLLFVRFTSGTIEGLQRLAGTGSSGSAACGARSTGCVLKIFGSSTT